MKNILIAFAFLMFISCKMDNKNEYDFLLDKEYIISSQSISKDCEKGIKEFLAASAFFGRNIEIERILRLEVQLDTFIYDKQSPYYNYQDFCIFYGVIIKPVDIEIKKEELQLVTLVFVPNRNKMMLCSEFDNDKLYIDPSFDFYNDLSLAFKNDCFEKDRFEFTRIDSAKYGFWEFQGIKNFSGTFKIDNQYLFDKTIYNGSWLFNSDKTIQFDSLRLSYKIKAGDFIISNNDTFNIVSLSSKSIFLLDKDKKLIKLLNNRR